VTGEMYSNIFYGANFVDYVGHVDKKLTMVHPVNGVGYDSFICDQYFDLRIDGPQAPDESAVEAIVAIKAIPERVSLKDKATVEAARAAYTKIATIGQQALVNNYSDLVSAEQRLKALAAAEEEKKNETGKEEETKKGSGALLAIFIAIGVIAALAVAFVFLYIVYRDKYNELIAKFSKKNKDTETTEPCEDANEAVAEDAPAEEKKEDGGNDEAHN